MADTGKLKRENTALLRQAMQNGDFRRITGTKKILRG